QDLKTVLVQGLQIETMTPPPPPEQDPLSPAPTV
ncbi:MAG: TIGR03899 family protein, partial [Aeromonas salmonicida]